MPDYWINEKQKFDQKNANAKPKWKKKTENNERNDTMKCEQFSDTIIQSSNKNPSWITKVRQ